MDLDAVENILGAKVLDCKLRSDEVHRKKQKNFLLLLVRMIDIWSFGFLVVFFSVRKASALS